MRRGRCRGRCCSASLIVTACYIGLNSAYLHILPISKVISSTRVAADAAFALAGPRGAAAISALVILSSVGVLNGVILAGPRTYYAMAEEGLAFRWLGRAHPRFRTPYLAIVLQAVWSCALVATGTYRAAVHARDLYRVDLLRADDGRLDAAAAGGRITRRHIARGAGQ